MCIADRVIVLENPVSFNTIHLNYSHISEYTSNVFQGKEVRKLFKKTYTVHYCLCVQRTNLEEMLKCDPLVEFVRFLCVKKWSYWRCAHRQCNATLGCHFTAYIPCDPLKYWPPPTWLHQRCFWLCPSPVPRCEIAAPQPPAQMWKQQSKIEMYYSDFKTSFSL